jgi:hypothetical protein
MDRGSLEAFDTILNNLIKSNGQQFITAVILNSVIKDLEDTAVAYLIKVIQDPNNINYDESTVKAALDSLFLSLAQKVNQEYVDDKINALVNGAGPAYDTLQEIGAQLNNDTNAQSIILTQLAAKINTADIVNTLTSTEINKPLSANQGKVLKGLIDGFTSALNELSAVDVTNKADKVINPVSGNFAGLNAAGNLIDSGKKPTDFEASGTALAQVNALKDSVPTAGDSLRKLYEEIQTLQALLTSNDVNLDTVQEIVTFIKNNEGLINSVSTNKINYSDIIDNLLSTATNRPLSANQGKILKGLIDTLAATIPANETQATILAKIGAGGITEIYLDQDIIDRINAAL